MTGDLELMAGTLYRIIEQKAFWAATDQERAAYLAKCREIVADVKAEQQQQPTGQKEVA